MSCGEPDVSERHGPDSPAVQEVQTNAAESADAATNVTFTGAVTTTVLPLSEMGTEFATHNSGAFGAEAITMVAGDIADRPAIAATEAVARATTRLEELGLLGRGGFGTVYATLDHVLLRTVAKKTFDRSAVGLGIDAQRFIEEAQITAQLDHPHIVPIHDFSADEHGRHYFTMKMVKGQTFTNYLRSSGRVYDSRTMAEHLEIFLKVCDAISFAHSRGVVHRDLKPDNIMIGSFGQVYVMDWGIAQLMARESPPDGAATNETDRIRTSHQPRAGAHDSHIIIGSFAYMAPEQAQGLNSKIDERTDIFALGAILYQILTDAPPYTGATSDDVLLAAMRAEIQDPYGAAQARGMPRGLVRIAMKAMRAAREDRYQSVIELQRDVEQFLRGGFLFATRTFNAGEIICKEGEVAHEAFIITTGQCEVFKTVPDGTYVLRTMGPGDVFGETAVLTGQPRSASVRALSPLTTTVIARESIEAELGIDNWMGAFVKALATRFLESDALLSRARSAEATVQVIAAILEYLCLEGRRRGRRVEAPWDNCLMGLRLRLGKEEADYLSIIGEHASIKIDLPSNVIFLESTTD